MPPHCIFSIKSIGMAHLHSAATVEPLRDSLQARGARLVGTQGIYFMYRDHSRSLLPY